MVCFNEAPYNEVEIIERGLMMRRLITGVVLGLTLVLVGWLLLRPFLASEQTYYTQITTAGQQQRLQAATGSSNASLVYRQPSYDAAGHQRVLTLTGHEHQPLARNSFLKIDWRRGRVRSWRRISSDQVPAKALTQIQLGRS